MLALSGKKHILRTVMVASFVGAIAGCASMCDPKDQTCIDNMNSVDEVIGGAAVIAADIATTPDTTTTTETRTCTTDRHGDQTCTTTTEGN